MSNRSRLQDVADGYGVTHIDGVPLSRATVKQLEGAIAERQPRRCRHCETLHSPRSACAASGMPLEELVQVNDYEG